jgi:Glucose/sorbosone dehydrogenases
MSGFVRFYLAWLVAVAGILISGSACGGGGDGGATPTPVPTPAFGLTSELVTPAAQADALAFAPDGRLFFVEHWTGNVRIFAKDGKLLPDPFAHIDDLAADIELGLTGLALDPDFAANHYVYVFYTKLLAAGPPRRAKPVVARFTESNNLASNMTTIVNDLPEVNAANQGFANGSLHFGPDGYLYLTLGDYAVPTETGPQGKELPEDLGTPIGKMLRLNKEDGSAAPDNPFAAEAGADPRIFAHGFRGAFDFAFHPQTRRIYGSDNLGATCEELNIIEKGTNYGWPKAVESTASPSTSPQSPQSVSTRPQGSDCRARQQFPAFYFLVDRKSVV